jgi:hypothetical protein
VAKPPTFILSTQTKTQPSEDVITSVHKTSISSGGRERLGGGGGLDSTGKEFAIRNQKLAKDFILH